ncbi:unnamed protein product [Lampetra fluviatilis]
MGQCGSVKADGTVRRSTANTRPHLGQRVNNSGGGGSSSSGGETNTASMALVATPLALSSCRSGRNKCSLKRALASQAAEGYTTAVAREVQPRSSAALLQHNERSSSFEGYRGRSRVSITITDGDRGGGERTRGGGGDTGLRGCSRSCCCC